MLEQITLALAILLILRSLATALDPRAARLSAALLVSWAEFLDQLYAGFSTLLATLRANTGLLIRSFWTIWQVEKQTIAHLHENHELAAALHAWRAETETLAVSRRLSGYAEKTHTEPISRQEEAPAETQSGFAATA